MSNEITHRLQANPRIRAQDFAEYMAASDVAKRSLIRRCKFRPLAPMLQHREAKSSIARWMREGSGDLAALATEAARIRRKLADTAFEADTNEHNAAYIEAFMAVCESLEIPACQMTPPMGKMQFGIEGLTVGYSPDLLLTATNRQNVAKAGALFLLYQKGKAAVEEPSLYLNSLSFAYLSGSAIVEYAETDKKLCVSVCSHSGVVRCAPGNAATRFKNMQAAAETIVEQWDAIKPQPNWVVG